jgi:hypothetical protein
VKASRGQAICARAVIASRDRWCTSRIWPISSRRRRRAFISARSALVEAVPVKETFNGKTVWEGTVHVFDLEGHPKAARAYAWSSPIEGSSKRRFYAVLHLGGIVSAVDAVRAAIVAAKVTFPPSVRSLTLGQGKYMTGDEGEIKAKRDAAARARRLLSGVFDPDMRKRMLEFAAALEAEANLLERPMQKRPAPQVTQMQMQVQQGPPAKTDAETEKKDRDPK